MRYLLVLMLLVVAVSVCHAADNKTEYAVSLDTTKINMGQQVDQVADALKKHLDGPLGMYYKATVAKNRLIGGIGFWTGIALLLFGLVGVVLGCAWGDANGPHIIILLGLLLVVGLPMVLLSATNYLAPEYSAMKEIIVMLRTVVH